MSFARWYLKHYSDPHLGLKVLSHAARLSRTVVMLKTPMPVAWTVAGPAWLKAAIALFWKFAAHVFLALRILRTKADTAVVREFLTLPLLVCAPLLLGARKRVWFLVQHNLNNTLTRPVERLALRVLSRAGFRFVVFEDQQAWRMAGIGPAGMGSLRELLHPVSAGTADGGDRSTRVGQPLTIGFIGNYRKEKSPEWALAAIEAALASGAPGLAGSRLLIGTPDAAFRAAWAGRAELRDTTDYRDFTQALLDCDVVVLPYTRDNYFFRVSGVVAEAVVCGCTVLVPGFPWLKHQVEFPATVGYCYGGPGDFIDQLVIAAGACRSAAAELARHEYLRSRGVDASTASLKRLATDGT